MGFSLWPRFFSHSSSLLCNNMYLSAAAAHPAASIEQQVFRIISKRKAIRASRVRKTASLARDLRFDTVDVVDIILELERNFHIIIPDEVPLYTVGDFVRFVREHAAA
ncbi:acyl carrier protein [Hymenobacter sp. PAMC 26628]|uniref:acyl carrier protein n=1 Tax=Hymenobacter sp. PAMC 26628 TaxID=1484118 RepID=UPI001F29D5EC|nr:acyl carrier protein [Hymenobacter sp. PAMC 26628]